MNYITQQINEIKQQNKINKMRYDVDQA